MSKLTLEDMGFTCTLDKDAHVVTTRGRLGAVSNFVTGHAKLQVKRDSNRDMMVDQLTDSSAYQNQWKGGSFAELKDALAGRVNMERFQKAKTDFERGAVSKRIVSVLQDVTPKRTRRLSEHDGEWSLERRWDIKPYMETYRTKSPARTVRVVANFAVLGSATVGSIARYGAMVWCLINAIEQAGIAVEAQFRFNSDDASSCGLRSDTWIEAKKAGEYLAPSILAGICSPLFFRRAIFGLRCASLDHVGKRITSGMGRSVQVSRPIAFENGVLVLGPSVETATSEELEREVLKAIA